MPQVDNIIRSMEDEKIGMQDVLGEYAMMKRLELVNGIKGKLQRWSKKKKDVSSK